MACSMREIEIKIRVKSIQEIKQKLRKLGFKLSQAITQVDKIFILSDLEFSEVDHGINVLRIRKEGSLFTFNLKRSISNELDSIEKEVTINDAEKMGEILRLMGYREVVSVKKKRIQCCVDDYVICLDDVDNLGFFIEIEKKTDAKVDVETIQNELISALRKFDIYEGEQIDIGYDTMIYNLKHF